MGFPGFKSIPISKIVSNFCGTNYVCTYHTKLFIDNFVDKKKPKGIIDTLEVQKALQDLLFGRHYQAKTNPFLVEFSAYLRRVFFANSPFDGRHSTITPLVFTARAAHFKDGDTFDLFWNDQKYTFRFGGVDAPESFVTSKLNKTIDYIFLYWIEYLGFRGDETMTKAMIANRIRYTGYLAGLVVKGLDAWVEENDGIFNTAPSFDRTSLKPEMVNTLVLSDEYGRLIGIPRVGNPDTNRQYLARFIEEELPRLMETKGMELYNYYRFGKKPAEYPWWLPDKQEVEEEIKWLIQEGRVEEAAHKAEDAKLEKIAALTKNGQRYLLNLKKSSKHKEIFEALSPDTLPVPNVIYSIENCKKLAKKWREFIKANPGYRNDIQAMLTFIGLVWAYPKYANQDTPVLMFAEAIAMGPLHKDKKNPTAHGLWGDIIFGYGQPNPEYSPIYKAYEYELSRGKELVPPDACDVLKKQGKDIYNHCP